MTAAPAELGAAGLRTFFRIAEAWELSLGEQRAALGNVAKQTLYNWRAHPEAARLSGDQLDRLSYLLGIYKALHIIFTRPEQADSWIRRANDAPPFGGKPAAQTLFSGKIEDMARVRRYLDGARSPW
ncbi:MAG TPA: antitoxin Xre-like helix-turn-helix domain-containing protein [Candidatus Elarobacter sp.]